MPKLNHCFFFNGWFSLTLHKKSITFNLTKQKLTTNEVVWEGHLDQLYTPQVHTYAQKIWDNFWCSWCFFEESKLGPKVLLKNRSRTTLIPTPIFVRGNPQRGMGHRGQPFTN
jgi:hypothetical protein